MEKNGKQGSNFLLIVVLGLFICLMYYGFDFEPQEWLIIGSHKFIYIPMQELQCDDNTPYENENEICRKIKTKKINELLVVINETYEERRLRIVNRDRKRTPDEIRKWKECFGLIKAKEEVNPNIVNNMLVNLRDVVKDYKNIKFKKANRKYNINKNMVNSNFKKALKEIDKTMSMTITETTEGNHEPGKFSHENGYKIDIRTKDMSYDEIVNVMTVFKKHGFRVAFEHENNEESLEIANKIKKEEKYLVRKSYNGEHVDINLAKK